MQVFDGNKGKAFSLDLDDTESDEIMAPFDGIIDTDLAVRAYDAALKNSSEQKNFSDRKNSDFSSDKMSDSSDSDFSTSTSDSDIFNPCDENQTLKNAYPIHEMDLETLARILSGQINIEDLVQKNYFKNNFNSDDFENSSQNETFYNQNNPQNSNNFYNSDDSTSFSSSENYSQDKNLLQKQKSQLEFEKYKENLSRSGTFYDPSAYKSGDDNQKSLSQENQNNQETQDSDSLKTPYFEEGFDFKGTTLFEFEDYLKRTRVPKMEDEKKAKKSKSKS